MNCEATTPARWNHWPGPSESLSPASAGLAPIALKGAGLAFELLPRKRVLFIGLGAVNGRTMERLAQSGIGHLVGADPDSYETASCWTQPCSLSDVGRSKARVQGERAKAAGPNASILTWSGIAQNLPYQLLWDADAWVAAADNLEVLVWAGVLAAGMGKPLFQGAVFGEQWLAVIRHWDLRFADHPCPGCQLSRQEWSQQRSRMGCDPGLKTLHPTQPTRTLPSVCGLAAEMLSCKVLSHVLGRDPPLTAAEECLFPAASGRFFTTLLERNSNCRCPHQSWHRMDIAASPSSLTLEDLVEHLGSRAARRLGTPKLQIRAELPWFHQAVDSAGHLVPTQRFAHWGTCWEQAEGFVTTTPGGMASTLTAADVRQARAKTLAQLGLPSGYGIAIEFEDQLTWLFTNPVILTAAESRQEGRQLPSPMQCPA